MLGSQNSFESTKTLTDFANQAPIRELLERIEDDEDYSPVVTAPQGALFLGGELDGILNEFVASASYKMLREPEKAAVCRAMRAFSENREPCWGVEASEPSHDTLLDYPDFAKRLTALSGDLLVVGGVTLLDIDRVAPGFWADNQEYAEARVSFANMIGAAILTKAVQQPAVIDLNTVSFFRDDTTRTRITLGGDFHGDFRIFQVDTYPNGSISPIGEAVPYAPHGNHRLACGYHSTEPSLLEATIKHLDAIGLTDSEQREIIEDAVEAFTTAQSSEDGPFTGFYGDYGDEGSLQFLLYNMEAYFMRQPSSQEVADEIVWAHLIVSPQGKRRLRIKTVGDTLELQNVHQDDEKDASSPVEIPKNQVASFIRALLHQAAQGAGRTAPASLLKLAQARLNYPER